MPETEQIETSVAKFPFYMVKTICLSNIIETLS